MMKKISILAVIGLVTLASFKFLNAREEVKGEADGIQWVTFEEAVELSKKKPKKIFVDVYTNWCGWCKRMDKATFQNPEVGKYMNKHYYCVKFNAEGKKDIQIGDKTYSNNGRNHQLARDLLDGRMSYPTVVSLDDRFSKLSPVPGYREPKDFLHIAKFFGENIYKEMNWEQYNNKGAE